jgi:hypothetical protein
MGSNQEKINSRISRMPNHPPISIRSFVGLCNFFRMHIKDFALIAAPLFKLMRKDSGYKSGTLPEKALKAFYILQKLFLNQSWLSLNLIDNKHSSQMPRQERRTLQEA